MLCYESNTCHYVPNNQIHHHIIMSLNTNPNFNPFTPTPTLILTLYLSVSFCLSMKEREKRKDTPVQAFQEGSDKDKRSSRVTRIASELEKILDIEHFLNIKSYPPNRRLCEKLVEERKKKETEKETESPK